VIADRLEGAFDSQSRNRGLLGREGLERGHALIIAPGSVVHTFFMRFPIDILFVARDGRVLKTRIAVPARRITGSLTAFAVIELAAHTLEHSDTRRDDRVAVVAP